MSGPKHAPGPWRLLARDGETIVAGPNDEYVAFISVGEHPDDANGKLIAAAPRLVEALRRVKEWNAEMHRANDPSLVPCLTSDLYNDWRELMTEVRAALREAGEAEGS